MTANADAAVDPDGDDRVARPVRTVRRQTAAVLGATSLLVVLWLVT
jgi:hypothetical protein